MMNRVFLTASVLLMGVVLAGAGNKTSATQDLETLDTPEDVKRVSAEYRDEIKKAPRRKSNDPIRVTVLSPLSKKERKKQKVQKIYKGLVKELESDPILDVTKFDYKKTKKSTEDDRSLAALIESSKVEGIETDVYVLMRLDPEKGNNSAEIVSDYDPKVYKAENNGTALEEGQPAQSMASEVRGIVTETVGPVLPAVAAVMEINNKYRKFRKYQSHARVAKRTGRFFKSSFSLFKKFKK